MLLPNSVYCVCIFKRAVCGVFRYTSDSVTAGRRPKKLAAEELFEYAVKSLGARASSAGDLKAKLRTRAANPADADAAIARLTDLRYLDDKRFAESYAAARVENEGFGRMRVLQDLRARRIAGDMADKAVEQAIGDKTEDELIEAFIARRMSSIASGGPIEDERKLAAAYRKLRRAGFTSGGILKALKRLAARPEEIEEPPEDES
jgi:regulatory protein